MTSWEDIREEFAAVVFRQGVQKVADEIPADPVTVYRLVNGVTKQPTRAVRAGAERVVLNSLHLQQTKDYPGEAT
tara:strand:- start:1514 stop:1738 length:225 start_codon:yes stop_codon:yes gene_type:complete